MRTFLLLLATLIASLALGVLATYIAIETLPCEWFGTSFEGACAYGALYASFAIGLLVAITLFAWLVYRIMRGRKKASPA